MKRNVLVVLFVLSSFLPGYGQTDKSNYPDIVAEANTLLDEAIQQKHFPGISAGIFKGDAIIWEAGRGYLNTEHRKKAGSNMLHRIASITKPMTAVAIMQLVEENLIDPDAPIQRYLPGFPEKPEGDITVRQLLNHTSGVKGYRNSKEIFPTKHYSTLTEAVNLFKNRALDHVPGTAFVYTTYGYTILGAIIESVTGITYAEYMKKNVWEKAGMLHTDIEEFGKTYPNKASLYKKTRKGKFVGDIPSDLSVKYPGGGLHSTAGDLLRFGQAILDHSLISSASLEIMMQTPAIRKEGTPYGLGWFVADDPVYGRVIRHSGSQSGTSTYLAIYLDKRIVVAVLSNASRTNNEVASVMKALTALAAKH